MSFVMVQCTKEMSDNDTNTHLQSRNQYLLKSKLDTPVSMPANSDCDINDKECGKVLTKTIELVPVLPSNIGGVSIPNGLIESGCVLGGIFTYKICPGNNIQFTDYQFYISANCSNLTDFMEGLNQNDYAIVYDYLSSWVENQGMQIIVQDYSNGDIEIVTVVAEVYKPLCYKTCRECRIFHTDEGPDFPMKESQKTHLNSDRKQSIELRGGDGPCDTGKGAWVFTTLRCGTGCCKTTIIYEKNQYGVMIVTGETKTSSGDCEGGPTYKCWGDIVIECTYSCN